MGKGLTVINDDAKTFFFFLQFHLKMIWVGLLSYKKLCNFTFGQTLGRIHSITNMYPSNH